MKSAAQHFDDLPEPYRSQALANTIAQGGDPDKLHPDLAAALSESFKFAKTPEGWSYWFSIYSLSYEEYFRHSAGTRKIIRYAVNALLISACMLLAALMLSCSTPQRWVLSQTSEIYHIDQDAGIITIYTPCHEPAPDCPGRLERIPLAGIDFPYVGKKLILR
jgi:hypothetical protein